MVTWFYFIVFLLALFMAANFLIRTKNADSMFALFSILVVVNCLGRYMLAAAQTLEMAIWANKFLYVGGCFAPLLILSVLARLCNQRIPRWLIAVLTAYPVSHHDACICLHHGFLSGLRHSAEKVCVISRGAHPQRYLFCGHCDVYLRACAPF